MRLPASFDLIERKVRSITDFSSFSKSSSVIKPLD